MITPKGVQKFGLGLGIVIVLNLFFNYGVYTFYKPPLYINYCDMSKIAGPAPTPAICESMGGQWTAYPDGPKVMPEQPTGYCNNTFTCQKEFDAVNDVYSRNVFLILLVLGLASIVGGVFLANASAVSGGLLYGGVLSLIIGAIRYWSNMDDILRFVILGITLAILLALGYRKLSDKHD